MAEDDPADRAVQLSTAKVYAVSDCVLCLGKVPHATGAVDAWKSQIGWFTSSSEYRGFYSIGRQQMVFEWEIFAGHTTLQLLEEIQRAMTR